MTFENPELVLVQNDLTSECVVMDEQPMCMNEIAVVGEMEGRQEFVMLYTQIWLRS